MNRIQVLVAIVAFAFIVSATTLASAATYMFSGTTLTDDVHLVSAASGNNFGTTAQLDAGQFSGTRRSLLRFDLTSLAGETVTGASLEMRKNLAGNGTYTGALVEVHEISLANGNWIEGTKNNAAASAGEPTWDRKASPSTTWAGSVGMGTSGVDYNATILATLSVNSADAIGTPYSTTFANVSFLQNWIDNPSQNTGFFLIAPTMESNGQLIRFGSSESGNIPVLTVTVADPLPVSAIPEPATITLLSLAGLVLVRSRRRHRHA